MLGVGALPFLSAPARVCPRGVYYLAKGARE